MTDKANDWRTLATSQGTSAYGPQRIVCLTEETTEWLYLLGEERRIVGISGYTVRPRRARDEKPRVSAFLDGKIDKIVALQPDLVIGFSDMQAALADKLIRAGLNTFRPARISLSASAACMSEKPMTRSGCSATILSILPSRNADTRGFSSRARRGRTV